MLNLGSILKEVHYILDYFTWFQMYVLICNYASKMLAVKFYITVFHFFM